MDVIFVLLCTVPNISSLIGCKHCW